MKNMMLQVKNCKESYRSQTGLTVKRSYRLFIAGLTVLCTVFFTGCKDRQNEPVGPDVKPGTTENPDWVITVENDMTASMTAIVKVSFTDKPGILAAFVGEDCCGVTTEEDYIDGLYFLYISPASNDEKTNDISLRFYSPDLKRIFEATNTFPFVNDGHQGTVAEPFTPEWIIAK